jgi:hypothetical protein
MDELRKAVGSSRGAMELRDRPKAGAPWTETDVMALEEGVMRGLSLVMIADQLQRPQADVLKKTEQLGLPNPRSGRHSHARPRPNTRRHAVGPSGQRHAQSRAFAAAAPQPYRYRPEPDRRRGPRQGQGTWPTRTTGRLTPLLALRNSL